ncbi:serine protease inhibitor 3/4-like [Cydia pomonella]|uniref:serine protease inhibitor 3/4-like n=1 Tax=Cydia pomonella TaxID=82600 RepID=UPI002ADDCF9C|nr:serine protease inhibitor 3/4-like [Cydia pomonella]
MDSVSFVILSLISCTIWDPRRTKSAFVKQNMLSGIDLNILRNQIGKNTVVSSFAFRLPLCKLAASASSTTRHEIISILDIHTLSQTKTCYSSLFPALSPLLETDLTMLNKIYVNYTNDIEDKFILDSQGYGITVSKIGYNYRKDAVAYVNREFSSKTYMRIRDILDLNDIDKNSSILIVNGFHYKGTWESIFAQASVTSKQFRSGKQTLKIEMMQTITQTLFLSDAKAQFKAISLHLSQVGVIMTFLLPYRNSSIIKLLDTMSQNPKLIENINKRMQWKFVNVALPKFKIKTCLDWTPYLKQIGLSLTTDMKNTGLNGILKDKASGPNMYVSKAKQKLFVEISEGPGRSQVGLADTPQVVPELKHPASPPVTLEDFTVDGPFFFTVTMTVRQGKRKRSNKIFRVFTGVYYGPE